MNIPESDLVEVVERLGDDAKAFAGKSVLFTGGHGFLGQYFSRVFSILNRDVLAEPVRVTMLDNLIASGGRPVPEGLHDSIRFENHDVIKPYETDETFDHIIHAAGIASPFYYRAHPIETLEVSIAGTRNMLDIARRDHAKVVFFSSSEIYGDPDLKHVPMAESYRGNVSCQGPRACYDESKRVGETLCYIYHEYFGVHTNTIRPFNVYGPGMTSNDYRVLPNFADRVKKNEPLQVYGSGNQTRTFCYITDAITGFLKVILNGVPGEAYNIGNPKPEISMLELVSTMEQVLGRTLEKNVIEYPDSYPADEPMRRCPDIRKAQLQLDFEPGVPLAEGLRRFLEWTDANYAADD